MSLVWRRAHTSRRPATQDPPQGDDEEGSMRSDEHGRRGERNEPQFVRIRSASRIKQSSFFPDDLLPRFTSPGGVYLHRGPPTTLASPSYSYLAYPGNLVVSDIFYFIFQYYTSACYALGQGRQGPFERGWLADRGCQLKLSQHHHVLAARPCWNCLVLTL